MKQINQFITEYIIKKKLDKPIDSENKYKYFPKTKDELINNIKELFDKGETDLNCIATNKITNMGDLFFNVRNINFDVSEWDVSNVTNMTNMFYGCSNFKDNGIENWNVNNVEIFIGMFTYCSNIYDIDFSNWNVSNGKYFNSMFFECKKFKGNGLENWVVGKVKDMSNMFYNCTNFNCDLSNWDISNVKNMSFAFYNCKSLKNKPSWYKE